MRALFEFFKSSAAGGLLIVLPLLLIYMLIVEVMGVLVVLATPIVDIFPEGTFGELHAPELLAIVILFGTSFLCGVMLRSKRLTSLGRRIEDTFLTKLPAYRAVKGLSRGLLSSGDEEHFHTAILNSGDDTKEVVYVTEDSGGEWVTVLVPWAPASFAGSLKIVRRAQVEPVDVSILDASASFANFGVGSLSMVERSTPRAPASEDDSPDA